MLTTKIGKVSKVIIVGMKGVGKTAILEQLIYGNINLDSEISPTIEDIYVASVDIGRGSNSREILRIYDTSLTIVQGRAQIAKHYLYFPDAFILVYDPNDPNSLDILADIKSDIDKYKEKKEVPIIVLANIHTKRKQETGTNASTANSQSSTSQPDPLESILNRANSWCSRERLKHYTVNAMERPSLYEPFISLCARLHPPQTKSTFPQLRQVMQKTQKNES